MDIPLSPYNRRISSNNRSESSESYSVSSNADSFYSYYNKKSKHLAVAKGARSDSSVHSNKTEKMTSSFFRIQKRQGKANDRLAVTAHTSDPEFKEPRTRAGLDRQHSISRWMADTVSEQCGKIRKAVSTHDRLNHMTKRPLSPEDGGIKSSMENSSSFRIFRRQDSQNQLSKPVRKRSSGPEGLIKDVLRAISGHERSDSLFSFGMNVAPLTLDDDDIEDDTDDEETEFHSDDTTPITTSGYSKSLIPLLSKRSSRWDASSPSREEKEHLDRLMRCSSKMMPVPPPPPFSPDSSQRSGVDVVPNDLFEMGQMGLYKKERQDNAMGGTLPTQPLRVSSNHLRASLVKKTSSPALAPLAAASAAIAIATNYINEDRTDRNDLTRSEKRSLHGENSLDSKTDAATEDSTASIDMDTFDDSEISLDGVSMLSASNTTFTCTTNQSNHSLGVSALGLGGASATGLGGSSTTGLVASSATGLATYMNKVQRDIEARKNVARDLRSFINKDKQNEEDLDFSYKSMAEDTYESACTFATDGYESPIAKKPLPVPLRASSDHHPALTLSRRDASIVPPCMPKRSVSNHKKIGIQTMKTPVSQRNSIQTTTTVSPVSPATPSDRVQQLLDFNERKYTSNRRSSLPENVASGTNQRFRQRAPSPETISRRRASIDSAFCSRTYGPPLLTPTITKTPRTSPSITNGRKRLVQARELSTSPQRTPPNSKNLSVSDRL